MKFTTNPFGGLNKPAGDFPRILGVIMDLSASSYYRIYVPLLGLARLGYPVGWAHIDQIPNEILRLYDMVILSRTGNIEVDDIQFIFDSIKSERNHKTLKETIVFLDYDDDVLHIPEHNPAHKAVTNIEGYHAAMRSADGIFCTNDTLAKVLREYNQNVNIVPNMVIPEDWPTDVHEDGALIIGLVGSESHIKDWEIVEKPLRRIKETFGEAVQIMTGGFLPDYFEGLIDVHIPWGPLDYYPHMVNMVDIGLCPLIDDAFNRAKSPIKAYEYALAGAAVVGSPVQYRTVLQGRGKIAKTDDEWYDAMAHYITNERARKEDAAKLRRYVEKSLYAPLLLKDKYVQVYRKAYAYAREHARPSIPMYQAYKALEGSVTTSS